MNRYNVKLQTDSYFVCGDFQFCKMPDGRIHISRDDGESGTFTVEQLLPYLRQFWREQF